MRRDLSSDQQAEMTGYHAQPVVIPNLHARNIVRDVCEKIVETTLCSSWSSVERDAFALGYVRGALETMISEGNPVAADFARTMLAQVNVGGVDYVRRLLRTVVGA